MKIIRIRKKSIEFFGLIIMKKRDVPKHDYSRSVCTRKHVRSSSYGIGGDSENKGGPCGW